MTSDMCQFNRTHPQAKGHGTCSEASLLLSLAQVAVGAEVGMGGRLRLAWFGPTFPLDEVGDPALGQGGGLRHMVSHCLRNTWANRRAEGEWSGQLAFYMSKGASVKKQTLYHLETIWREQQTHEFRHSSWSPAEIFPISESFQSPLISPRKLKKTKCNHFYEKFA